MNKMKVLIILILLLIQISQMVYCIDIHYNCCIYVNPSAPVEYKLCKSCIVDSHLCPSMTICPISEKDKAQFILVDFFWVPSCCMCNYNTTLLI
jgi:hypothetical protein